MVEVKVASRVSLVYLMEVGVVKVLGVQVEKLGLFLVEKAGYETPEQTEGNAHAQGAESSSDLQASLLVEAVGGRKQEISVAVHRCYLRVEASVVEGNDDGAPDASKESGHSVKVVDAAGVVETHAVEKFGSEVVEAEGADHTGAAANEKGDSRSVDEGAGGSHNDSSGDGGVEDVFHVEAPSEAEGRDDVGAEDTSGERDDGVDDD